jgi:hypothetical protein
MVFFTHLSLGLTEHLLGASYHGSVRIKIQVSDIFAAFVLSFY